MVKGKHNFHPELPSYEFLTFLKGKMGKTKFSWCYKSLGTRIQCAEKLPQWFLLYQHKKFDPGVQIVKSARHWNHFYFKNNSGYRSNICPLFWDLLTPVSPGPCISTEQSRGLLHDQLKKKTYLGQVPVSFQKTGRQKLKDKCLIIKGYMLPTPLDKIFETKTKQKKKNFNFERD